MLKDELLLSTTIHREAQAHAIASHSTAREKFHESQDLPQREQRESINIVITDQCKFPAIHEVGKLLVREPSLHHRKLTLSRWKWFERWEMMLLFSLSLLLFIIYFLSLWCLSWPTDPLNIHFFHPHSCAGRVVKAWHDENPPCERI